MENRENDEWNADAAVSKEEEERSQLRRQKREAMRQQKERQELLRKKIRQYFPMGMGAAVGILVIAGAVSLCVRGVSAKAQGNDESGQTAQVQTQEEMQESRQQTEEQDDEELLTTGQTQEESQETETTEEAEPEQTEPEILQVGTTQHQAGYEFTATEDTGTMYSEEIICSNAILADLSTNTITASRGAKERINPASMTKILTVLVAAEHVTDLDDTFTMTIDITDYAYVNDCSSVGFLVDEVITVRDLFYGTILPSGGDAAVALATYVAGSQEAFVDMMNDKLEELGLSDTAHMTNCVGLYDAQHYCTVYDMAVILKAAVENDWCREVLSLHTYTTQPTQQHEDGITISNWFLRRIEDKETGGEVLCAKTGYVLQSGNCAASYYLSEDNKPYICVTVNSYSSWRCIYDHVEIYQRYAASE